MPSRHSKHSGDRGFYTHSERNSNDRFGGSRTERLSADSQLPFGYCPLSLVPIEEAVITPSGRLYSREAILDYLLQKMQDIKGLSAAYEKQQEEYRREEEQKRADDEARIVKAFTANQTGIETVVGGKRAAELTIEHIKEIDHCSNLKKTDRLRAVDDRDKQIKVAELQAVAPWIPQFTPQARASSLPPPPKRPSSPFSGQPLRTKDLIPINLKKDNDSATAGSSGHVRFVCPVSLKTITNQKVIVLKNTKTLMLESIAEKLAYPTMTCPITGKIFKKDDVLPLVQAASGFAASGSVEATKYQVSK